MRQCNTGVKLIIVGDGPLRTTLQKEYPDIHCCGLLTGEQLATHYASADVFLFPSETETFGNVTLEALASGLAVVAYDYAAAKMHIAQGKTGILIPHGDANGFVAAAAQLVREPHLLDTIRRTRGQPLPRSVGSVRSNASKRAGEYAGATSRR